MNFGHNYFNFSQNSVLLYPSSRTEGLETKRKSIEVLINMVQEWCLSLISLKILFFDKKLLKKFGGMMEMVYFCISKIDK